MMIYFQHVFLALPFFAVLIGQAQTCFFQDKPKTRTFKSLIEYQANKVSFDLHDDGFEGNRVEFNFSSVDRIPKNAFITFTSNSIIEINLNNKDIRIIDEGAFMTLSCLHHLDLSGNKLTNLSAGVFQGLENLRTLDLSRNTIQLVPHLVFGNLKSIMTLNLSGNVIAKIEKFAFRQIATLEKLILSNNKMKILPADNFEELGNLRELDFHSNLFVYVNVGALRGSDSLETLNLARNQLVVFHMDADRYVFKAMKFLNLSNNYLLNLDVRGLKRRFPNANFTVDINFNRFYCAELEVVLHELRESRINIVQGKSANSSVENIVCDGLNATRNYWDLPATVPGAVLVSKNHSFSNEHSGNTGAVQDSGTLTGLLVLICFVCAFCIFFTLDYVLGTGVFAKIYGSCHPRSNNAEYVNLT